MSSKARIILGKFSANSIEGERFYMKDLLEISYGGGDSQRKNWCMYPN